MCLNGVLSCVDFMDVIMGDIPLFPHVNNLDYIYHKAAIYNLTTLCLNGTLSYVDFMDVIMGDIPLFPHVNTT